MQTGQVISLSLYFLLMLGIGLYAYRQASSNLSGYMLGGRSLGPAVTALSAGASDMSGWILMGLPGALYVSGLVNVWIVIGLLIGAYVNYLFLAPRLRVYTEEAGDAITLPDYFENRFNDSSRLLRILSSLVIIIFFTLYTSSGVVAGGKLFESAFGQSYELGLYLTAGVVVLYTLFGGFLAVSLTDFVQGCIMLIALVLVPVVAFSDIGGMQPLTDVLNQQSEGFLNIFNGVGAMAIISAMAWGLGYFGQPHIIVRFMAIRDVKALPVARRIGMSWMLLSVLGALATGLVGLAYVKQHGAELADAETIFIYLSGVLFHPLISGFLLAAVLAAIMSTISSQLLVTSSSLTEDIYKAFFHKHASDKELVLAGRLSVVLVALVAILLATRRDSSILQLVSYAWAGFGAAFGPVILLSLFWKGVSREGTFAGMLSGAVTVLWWSNSTLQIDNQSLNTWLYAIVPGCLVAALATVLVSWAKSPSEQVLQGFQRFSELLKR
ncbi:sodium/proline symporter PutP [Bowmanella sp. JS7-9]|uniref:Sodium/proline symporter n=1 Tax=Pseudobowmanella zhangzhouensis TaxID=1537679 RepID=A0ABW1XP78_9ALTE|nr:sodium/proline symporter PutP [Bowmanella sp. JS7-9]TBX22535.1 proline:sodium symporter PutP [Bowmanella sp. JS7-9]